MTIILFARDERCLIADSCETRGGVAFRVQKIFRNGNLLAAAAGPGDYASAIIHWMLWYRDDPSKFPATQSKDDYALGLLVVPFAESREVLHVYDRVPHPICPKDEYYAVGSGKDAALGAILAGAKPDEAVKIACQVDINCRGPIQVEHFG